MTPKQLSNFFYFCALMGLTICLATVIAFPVGLVLKHYYPPVVKASPKGYYVTLYNHDGSIRGQYHNVSTFEPGIKPYKTTDSYSSSVLYLPEYGVYINGEYVIAPEKD